MLLIYLEAFLASSLVFAQGNDEEDFLVAVHAGNLDAVRSFLNGPNFKKEMLNTLNREKQSPLYVAMNEGHVDVALELMKKTYNFNLLQRRDCESYLHLAIRKEGLMPCLVEMLNRNVNPNIRNMKGSPVLHSATSLGDRSVQIIDLLIKKGKADMEITDGTGYTALHRAIEEMNAPAVVALIKYGANLEAKTSIVGKAEDTLNINALHHAIYVGNLDVIKAIVEIGKADIEKKDPFERTALSAALYNIYADVVLYLVSRNADANAVDPIGRSILKNALETYRMCKEREMEKENETNEECNLRA